jgi:hypothetical protein
MLRMFENEDIMKTLDLEGRRKTVDRRNLRNEDLTLWARRRYLDIQIKDDNSGWNAVCM